MPQKRSRIAYMGIIPHPPPLCKSLPRFLRKFRQNLGQSGGTAEGRRGDDGTSEAGSPALHRGRSVKSKKKDIHTDILLRIGVTGLEPAASWSRTKHSTKLSHTPIEHRYYTTAARVCQGDLQSFFGNVRKFHPAPHSGRAHGICRLWRGEKSHAIARAPPHSRDITHPDSFSRKTRYCFSAALPVYYRQSTNDKRF